MQRFFPLFLIGFLLSASIALAEDSRLYAGTDSYLREAVGLSEEQLSTMIDTLDREAFDLVAGEQSIADPLGDVLSHKGATAGVQVPWADIRAVDVFRNEETQTWDVSITTGGIVPTTPPEKAQFILYADRDGNERNNEPDGIRVNVDAEFSVEYDRNTDAWVTDFRWYNPEPDFWAIDQDTALTHAFEGDTILMHVPFDELPSNIDPKWRVVVAVTDGGKTQVDTVPGIGFPPPKGEVYPEAPEKSEEANPWVVYGLIAIILAATGTIFWRMRKKH